jgi:L-histidine N-alpha-methyltransferase
MNTEGTNPNGGRGVRTATPSAANGRLSIEILRSQPLPEALARDVRLGLSAPQKSIPPKYFYDDRGSALFDAICDLPEYYLSRAGQALLDAHAEEIIAVAQPHEVVELGSGTSRKTRVLLNALTSGNSAARYLPFDVSEGTLRQAAAMLLEEYPPLRIHAMVGDYEQDLERLPRGRARLVLFLGSTIGNFTPAVTADFLARLRGVLSEGDHLLVGIDLVKTVEVLEAAYNDRAGVTAEFNRNVLRVINRHLQADFEPDRFEHVAFFNRAESQIEMHLRARTAHTVNITSLGLSVRFDPGETIHTEISRKFTHPEVCRTLLAAGFDLVRWYAPGDNAFALALARAR